MYRSNTNTTGNLSFNDLSATAELICFSHLRWDFVFQRPQHLLCRFARTMRVWYIEEPVYSEETQPRYVFHLRDKGVTVIVPHLPKGLSSADDLCIQQELFDNFMTDKILSDITFWYYTPMALPFTRKYDAAVTVFDCMDELSAFKFAPAALKSLEKELLKKADVVFTGGYSLYEAKKSQHPNIYAFPSSIDKEHFKIVRDLKNNHHKIPAIKKLTLGFYGVIDERFDVELIRGIAEMQPDWEIVLIGPVVKIDPAILPSLPNIQYLGGKSYDELPEHMAKWDIALIPFLINASTRFISPTKTPEYLSAGLPVISTPIKDVINPYGEAGLVSIGFNAKDFIAKAKFELDRERNKWLKDVDSFLAGNSWDITTRNMQKVMSSALNGTSSADQANKKYV